MIERFFNVQSGFVSTLEFKSYEITKRVYSLQLSRHLDLESVHSAGVNSLDVDPAEDRYLLSACSDGSIYIHDLNNFSGKVPYTAKCICKVLKNTNDTHKYSIECASWYGQENSLFITSGTDKTVKIWDTNSLKSVENFQSKGRVFHHHCSPAPSSHPMIAVASSVNHVDLIDLRTGGSTQELRGHTSSVLACCWSPKEEHHLATGGFDNKIFLWDTRSSNSCLKVLDQHDGNSSKTAGTSHSGHVNGLRFTSDGLLLVSFGTDNRLRLWETLNGRNQMINYGKVKNKVKKHVQISVSDNSKPQLIFVPSGENLYVLELLTGKLVLILYGHFNSVNCCLYRDSYQELYSGGNDRNVLMWTADDDSQREAVVERTVENRNVNRNVFARTADNWSSDED